LAADHEILHSKLHNINLLIGTLFYPETLGNGCSQFLYLFFNFEIEDQHVTAKAQETVDHLAIILSGGEEISQPGFKPSTFSLRFGYLSIIIQ
jgi:hypothetical protein